MLVIRVQATVLGTFLLFGVDDTLTDLQAQAQTVCQTLLFVRSCAYVAVGLLEQQS